jgi:hypothetical protein
MNIKILFGTIMTLALFTTAYAQTLDSAKLDQFFDRLAEKNKANGESRHRQETARFFTPAPSATARSAAPKRNL